MAACGAIQVFHVGGVVEDTLGDNTSTKHWEFFIGDLPHATGDLANILMS